MYGRSMPKLPWVKLTIASFLVNTNEDFRDDDFIEFSQRTTTDRSNFTHHIETVNEFVNNVIEQLHQGSN